MEKQPEEKKKMSLKDFFSLGEVGEYFFRTKKDNNNKADINLRMMHSINRIAILVFLASIIYLIFKRFI